MSVVWSVWRNAIEPLGWKTFLRRPIKRPELRRASLLGRRIIYIFMIRMKIPTLSWTRLSSRVLMLDTTLMQERNQVLGKDQHWTNIRQIVVILERTGYWRILEITPTALDRTPLHGSMLKLALVKPRYEKADQYWIEHQYWIERLCFTEHLNCEEH